MGHGEEVCCPACGQALGVYDDVFSMGGGDWVAGCSRCLALRQADDDGPAEACDSGEWLARGEWYWRHVKSGRPVGSARCLRRREGWFL